MAQNMKKMTMAEAMLYQPEQLKQRVQSTAQQAVDHIQQQEAQRQAAAASAPAWQREQQAQQELDDYRASEAYHVNQGERNREALKRALEMTFAVPGSVSDRPMNVVQVQPERDAREEQLRQQVDQYREQAEAEREQSVREADLARLETWTEEDRAALDSYIIARDQLEAYRNNPMTDKGFLPQLPENARQLIARWGQAEVEQLARTVTRQRDAELTEQTAQWARDGVNSGAGAAVGHNIASIPAAAVGGLTGLMSYLQELGRGTGRYKTLDPNNIGNLLNVYASNVRGQTVQNIAGDQYDENGQLIQDGGIGRQALAYGYQALMTVADTYGRMLLGGGAVGGAALAATSTFSQTMSEASARGATPGQAALLATTTAGIEALSEKIPLDKLVKTAGTNRQTAMQIVKTALAQASIEATTEEISLLGSMLAEAAILQEKAAYKDMTAEDILREVAATAIVSGIAGGASSAGASLAGNLGAANLQQNPENAAVVQQNQGNAADAQADTGGLPRRSAPSNDSEGVMRAMEETAAQWAQEAPRAEPAQKTEAEQHFDRAYEMTMGNGQAGGQEPADSGSSVREQLRNNQDMLNAQAPVAEIRAPQEFARMNKAEKMNWVIEKLRPTNYRVDRKGFGVINFAKKQLKSAFNYFRSGSAEEAAFEALPYVLENGVEISSRQDHKGRDYGTVTIAAPVTINGRRGNMAVVVKQTTDNFYKIHRILTPDGSVFELSDANSEAEPTPAGESPNNGSLATPISSASVNSIPQNETVVNAGAKNNGDVTQVSAEDPSADHETNARSALASPSSDYRVPESGGNVNGNFDEGRGRPTEERPGIKGTGAAERNFAGTAAYDDLLTDDNVQRGRADDVRLEEVPKKDADGRDVSENVGNAMGSNLTADAFTNTIKRLVTEGQLSHDTQTNKETLDKAAKAIVADGGAFESARKLREVADSGRTSAVDEAKSLLIYSYYQDAIHAQSNTGEGKVDDLLLDAAADIYVTMAKFATNSGRSQQLFTLFRKMTTDGQMRVIQQEIGRYVSRMKQLGNVPKGYEFQIDQNLLEDYRKACEENKRLDNAKTRKALEEKQNAIYMAEAAKLPATFKAKWDAWRYMCMLGNAKTQVRNIGGNVAFMPYKAVKDALAAGLERIAMDQSERTKAVLTFGDRQLLDWAKSDSGSEAVHNALKYSAKLGDDVSGSILEENRVVFDDKGKIGRHIPKVMDGMETVRNFVEKVPAETDLFFKNAHYAQSLAGFLKARGYSAADIQKGRVSDATLNEGRAYAIQEAMKATFNDCNAFSDFMSSIGRNPAKQDNSWAKAANFLCEGILPFRRTPANIVVRFEEYSPVGLINTVVKAADYLRGGETSAASVIDSMASAMTGSAALALGFFLAKGIGGFQLTGSDVSEDEKRQGHQEYAVEFSVNGTTYSYKIDWAAPANLPLFVGANLYSLFSGNGQEDVEVSKLTSFIYGLGTMFEPMLSLSCLSSLNDLIESGKYADDGKALYSAAVSAVTSYFTQGIPALARQAVQAFQKNKQATFANASDPLLRDLQYMAAGTGVVPALKTDAVNAWGETESQGNAFMRIFIAFFNPGTLKAVDNSALEQEIIRLNESQPDSVTPPDTAKTISYTAADGTRHTGYRLTEEEYHTLATVQGQTAKEILEKIIESDAYAAMTDQQKASVFGYVYDYAREKGRTEALTGYEGMTGWMQGIKGREADVILDKAITGVFTDAFELLAEDPEGAAEALEQAEGLLKDGPWEANFANAAGGRVKYYFAAKNSGVSTETFLELYSTFRSIDTDPDLNTEGRAARWAYELQKAVESGTITAAQRDKLKETMVYYQMFPAETEKFDQMTENGISADDAVFIGNLLEGITPQAGYTNVRTVQKISAIAGTDLTDAEMEAVMKVYLSDAQDENLDLMLALGYGPEDYAAAYEIHSDANGKKAQTISGLQEEFGISWAQAKAIYDIFG